MRLIVTFALLTSTVMSCGQRNTSSSVKAEGQTLSLKERIEVLEVGVEKQLIIKRAKSQSLKFRLESLISQLGDLNIKVETPLIPLIASLGSIEAAVADNLCGWKPLDRDFPLITRIAHVELALVPLTTNVKKLSLLARLEVLKKKFAEMDVEITTDRVLINIISEMEAKLKLIETAS